MRKHTTDPFAPSILDKSELSRRPLTTKQPLKIVGGFGGSNGYAMTAIDVIRGE